jgi:hypothetical protein
MNTQVNKQWQEIVGVVWLAALFVLAIGVTSGLSDHQVYLLEGFAAADPQFLPDDWYIWGTEERHALFASLLGLLASSGFLELGLGIGTIFHNALLAVAIYLILRAAYKRPLLLTAATLLAFAAVDTAGVGWSNLTKGIFTAANLASGLTVVAIALLAKGRVWPAGLCFGAAGLIHAHYALLLVPLLVVLALAEPRRTRLRFSLGLWIPFLLISLPTLTQVLRFGADPHLAATLAITEYRLDQGLTRESIEPLFAAALAGVGGVILRFPTCGRRLAVTVGTISLLVFGSLLLVFTIRPPLLTQTWPWRLSPIVIVAGLAAAVAILTEPDGPSRRGMTLQRLGLAAALVGGMVWVRTTVVAGAIAAIFVVAIPAALAGAGWLSERFPDRRRLFPLLPYVWVTLGFLPLIAASLGSWRWEIRPVYEEQASLYTWARQETPANSMFVVPLDWADFRLHARRPLVVDWRGFPRQSAEVLEWFRRLQAVTGVQEAGPHESFVAGYLEMDCVRAETLRSVFGVRYIVLPVDRKLECARASYDDGSFVAWDLEADPNR